MNFKWVVQVITPVETFGAKQTPKQTLVLKEAKDQYPQSIAIDVRGDKLDILAWVEVGDTVDASLNIYSNEYNGKHYNNISARKIEVTDKGDSAI